MSFLFGRRDKQHIPKNTVFRITQEGTEQLQKFSGDPKSRVLVALETSGSSNVNEIANASGLNRGRVERMLLEILIPGGFVQPVNAHSASEGEGGE